MVTVYRVFDCMSSDKSGAWTQFAGGVVNHADMPNLPEV